MKSFENMYTLEENGFELVPEVYDSNEVNSLINLIEKCPSDSKRFRKSTDLFAIRHFLKEVPDAIPVIFNLKLQKIIGNQLGNRAFLVKAIYFDKPPGSNWFVASHQDLCISVSEQKQVPGFVNWTKKEGQFSVQPPLPILENILTVRIHLDDTDEHNGALTVLNGSHRKGIIRFQDLEPKNEDECLCAVPTGGVMLMKPLLFHRSARSSGTKRRRVIHLEFSNADLPETLEWAEKFEF